MDRKDVEESGCDPIWSTCPTFDWTHQYYDDRTITISCCIV